MERIPLSYELKTARPDVRESKEKTQIRLQLNHVLRFHGESVRKRFGKTLLFEHLEVDVLCLG